MLVRKILVLGVMLVVEPLAVASFGVEDSEVPNSWELIAEAQFGEIKQVSVRGLWVAWRERRIVAGTERDVKQDYVGGLYRLRVGSHDVEVLRGPVRDVYGRDFVLDANGTVRWRCGGSGVTIYRPKQDDFSLKRGEERGCPGLRIARDKCVESDVIGIRRYGFFCSGQHILYSEEELGDECDIVLKDSVTQDIVWCMKFPETGRVWRVLGLDKEYAYFRYGVPFVNGRIYRRSVKRSGRVEQLMIPKPGLALLDFTPARCLCILEYEDQFVVVELDISACTIAEYDIRFPKEETLVNFARHKLPDRFFSEQRDSSRSETYLPARGQSIYYKYVRGANYCPVPVSPKIGEYESLCKSSFLCIVSPVSRYLAGDAESGRVVVIRHNKIYTVRKGETTAVDKSCLGWKVVRPLEEDMDFEGLIAGAVYPSLSIASLHAVAWWGDINDVRSYVDKGFGMNREDGSGHTPLYLASKEGRIEVVKLLIANGANVNHASWGECPLHAAVRKGHREIVELLLANGGDVNAKTANGWTGLHIAASRGDEEMATFLLDNGADVNAKTEVGWGYRTGFMPLHVAVLGNHKGVVKLLLSRGAEVNSTVSYGPTRYVTTVQTALDLAEVKDYEGIVELLQRYGAKIESALQAEMSN